MPEKSFETFSNVSASTELLTSVLLRRKETLEGALTIVLLVDQFPATLGGGERVVLRTASLLKSAGYQVSIVTFQILCPPNVLQPACCPTYLLPLSDVFSRSGAIAAWQLGRFLRHERVDIVMTFFESANLFGGIATKLLSRAKLIWNRRDMGILRMPKHRLAYRFLSWLPDRVIAVSEQVRQHAIEVDNVPPNRVDVVYNGQDAVNFLALESEHPPIVIAVGNIRPVKGQDVLIEAAALVLKRLPNTRFQIIGDVLDPDYYARLKDRLEDLKIESSVRFLGEKSQPEIFLSKASVFVLPSRSEGFSNSIVEAMFAGLPVVATAVGGNAEAVLHNDTGVIVPPESPQDLADALVRVLERPDQARRMGSKGKERAIDLFTSTAMVGALKRIFESLTVAE